MRHTMLIGVSAVALTIVACGPGDNSGETIVVEDETDSGSSVDSSSPDAGPPDGGAPDTGRADTGRADAGDTGDTADGGETSPGGLPVLGNADEDTEAVEVTTAVETSAGLDGPRDAEFNPESPDQLWIVNRNDHSTVVVSETGTDQQSSTRYAGRNNRHFLAKPAALAFGQPGRMATAQQENKKTQRQTPPDFMGVTMWSTDLSTFDAGHGGHLDMLHNSPLASGIAWDDKNAYWVLDGSHGSATRYDFNDDHGPGGTDHKDGVVRRYLDGQLKVNVGVVSHVAFDRESGLLYIADTGNQRVVELDTTTGEVGERITPNYDGSDQKYVRDAESRTLVEGSEVGLGRPAGLELHDGHLFVGDNETSTVHAFTLEGEPVDSLDLSEHVPAPGLQGMTFDDQGRLYVVDSENDTVLRVAPTAK